jgi:hypothetical protein
MRSRTIGGRFTVAERRAASLLVYPDDVERPQVRGDCEDGPRPCPWVTCRHHLYLDVILGRSIKLNHPHLEVDELQETCALDVADRGGETLERVGQLYNVTRERVRQIEEHACEKIRDAVAAGAASLEAA